MLKLDSGTTEHLLYRIQQHQTSAFEHLTSEVGVRISNYWLLEDFKSKKKNKFFKARLQRILMSKALYSVDEFIASHWET